MMGRRMTAKRIALIHATPVAIPPVREAFSEFWPEAEPIDLLDSSLSSDRAAVQSLSEDLTERICNLVDYAERRAAASGILFTCSAFGPAIEEGARRSSIPVLKPNQAMFEAALSLGGRIGLVATFAPSISTMAVEFEEMRAGENRVAELVTLVVPEAMERLRAGDVDSHNRLVAEGATELTGCDAIMLAHFSTAQAIRVTQALVKCPVLTAPQTAVTALRQHIERGKAPTPRRQRKSDLPPW